jgi:hypothetical protein
MFLFNSICTRYTGIQMHQFSSLRTRYTGIQMHQFSSLRTQCRGTQMHRQKSTVKNKSSGDNFETQTWSEFLQGKIFRASCQIASYGNTNPSLYLLSLHCMRECLRKINKRIRAVFGRYQLAVAWESHGRMFHTAIFAAKLLSKLDDIKKHCPATALQHLVREPMCSESEVNPASRTSTVWDKGEALS